MDGFQIRNFRDFLLVYNQISETCFKRCAHTFLSRDVSTEEEQCVQNCAQKYIHANHKIMDIYMEVQPILVRKRIDEMNQTQAALEAQAQAQATVQEQVSEQVSEQVLVKEEQQPELTV